MIITLYNPGTTIKFTARGTDIIVALNHIKRVVGDKAKVYISVFEGRLRLIAGESAKYMYVGIPATKISGEGTFSVDTDVVRDSVQRRAELMFTFKDSKLQYRNKGKYRVELTINPVLEDAIDTINTIFDREEGSVTMSQELIAEIEAGIEQCNIIDVYTGEPLLRYIVGNGTSVEVSSYDQYHMVFYRKKTSLKVEPFEVAFDDAYFKLIKSIAQDGDIDLMLNPELFRLYYEKGDIEVVYPPLQIPEGAFGTTRTYIRDLDIKESEDIRTTVRVTAEDFKDVVDNLSSVYDAGSKIKMKLAESAIETEIITNYGKVSDLISLATPLKGEPCEFSADPLNLGDTFRCLDPGEYYMRVRFSIHENEEEPRPSLYILNATKAQKLPYTLIHVGSTV